MRFRRVLRFHSRAYAADAFGEACFIQAEGERVAGRSREIAETFVLLEDKLGGRQRAHGEEPELIGGGILAKHVQMPLAELFGDRGQFDQRRPDASEQEAIHQQLQQQSHHDAHGQMDVHGRILLGRILIELDRLGPGEVVGLQIVQGLADIMNATGLTVIL